MWSIVRNGFDKYPLNRISPGFGNLDFLVVPGFGNPDFLVVSGFENPESMMFPGFTNPIRAFIQFLFLQMNFDHNAGPLQQLVDCSDAFSSNEVILIL